MKQTRKSRRSKTPQEPLRRSVRLANIKQNQTESVERPRLNES